MVPPTKTSMPDVSLHVVQLGANGMPIASGQAKAVESDVQLIGKGMRDTKAAILEDMTQWPPAQGDVDPARRSARRVPGDSIDDETPKMVQTTIPSGVRISAELSPTFADMKRQSSSFAVSAPVSPVLSPLSSPSNPLLPPLEARRPSTVPHNDTQLDPFETPYGRRYIDELFREAVRSVREAIARGIYPQRIVQGSSGSYFCRNADGDIVGVFKPKNEEPYGKLNPKWTKWLHKNLFPCCFGRSCLIPNLGYISEAAASLVDKHLFGEEGHIVPSTAVVALASPTFYYSYRDWRAFRKRKRALPSKLGSFQLFMHNYVDAVRFLRNHHASSTKPETKLSPTAQREFQADFERLVVLDYLIRNTDRGLDNWMVRYTPKEEAIPQPEPLTPEPRLNEKESVDATTPLTLKSVQRLDTTSPASSTSSNAPLPKRQASVSIAAIDNGLAFPHKHPDQWRSYPYGWASLPLSAIPFSDTLRAALIPSLGDPSFWESLEAALQDVFKMDQDYDETLWRRQWALIRGQGFNILKVLKRENATPLDLLAMDRVLIFEDTEWDRHRPALEANIAFVRMEESPSFMITRHSQTDLEQAFDASASAAMNATTKHDNTALPSNKSLSAASRGIARGKQTATIWKGKVLSFVKRRPWFSYF